MLAFESYQILCKLHGNYYYLSFSNGTPNLIIIAYLNIKYKISDNGI